MSTIGILGAGTWGMALGRMLSNTGYQVTVWSAIEKEIDDFSKNRIHLICQECGFRKKLYSQKA